MQVSQAISERRSIRKYKDAAVPREVLEQIVRAGMLAPSAKNRQPWRFVAVEGEAKAGMLAAMRAGLERERTNPRLPGSEKHLAVARHTVSVMENAPVTVFVLNPYGVIDECPTGPDARFQELSNLQSVGACIENMVLAAVERGLGSLWNCYVFLAREELARWLGTREQIMAAVSFGVPDEQPSPRPRKSLDEALEWKSGAGC